MAADNQTTIAGNLVEDPELRFTGNGTPVTNLRVAVTQRVQDNGTWATATAPSSRSTLARPSRTPGRLPGQGRPGDGHRPTAPTELGDPEGEKRSVAEIEADEVGASLRFATAKVERATERGGSDRPQSRERQAERGGDFNEPPPF
jgi:single-strand DNA-binding protein